MLRSIPRRKKLLFSWDAQKVKEKKLMITLLLAELHAARPKLADSDPKGRYVSIIKDTNTHNYSHTDLWNNVCRSNLNDAL